MSSYWYLIIAIATEVIATSALKSAEEFTKLVPSAIVVIGYLASFYFMMLVLRTLPVGITYAIWSGVGIVLVAIIAMVLYQQVPDLPAMIGMALIITGVELFTYFQKRWRTSF
ncbi:MAG: multidrug efflux SMR transporter [Colwellia sp.]|nr:multidrug efflux SMR transporter [Colwellia sp.]MCW8864809.1 multidrug efflux SMR transporter [Colwellia sp.]MCW9081030.1 multidrug efflux SMR transporter [Colwellia sp.]